MFHVFWKQKNGSDAITLAIKHQPEVVLMDLSMPDGLNRSMVAKHILSELSETKSIVLTMHDKESDIKKALKIQIHSYLLKTVTRKRANKLLKQKRYYKTTSPAISYLTGLTKIEAEALL